MSSLLRAALLAAPLLALAPSAAAQCVVTESGSGVHCAALIAGQNINAGSVCIEIVNGNLLVTYNTTGGWQLVETHLWIGTVSLTIPQTKSGNPKIGNFPYHSGDITGATTYTHTIPISNLFTCPSLNTRRLYVAAHAVVRKDGQIETAWSEGSNFSAKGNWGTYTAVLLTCDCTTLPPTDSTCRSSFLYVPGQATAFTDLPLSADVAGWTNHLTGYGTYQGLLYADAGAGNKLVGTATVVYSTPAAQDAGGKVSISVQMSSCGSELLRAQDVALHVGGEILPRDTSGELTTAYASFPLQYAYGSDIKTQLAYEFDLVPGIVDPYVILYVSACGPVACFN